MADSGSTVRQRKVQKEKDESDRRGAAEKIQDEDKYSLYLDVFRVIAFIFVVSCGLSYLISAGETWFWGMKHPPKYLQVKWWQSQLVSSIE